MDCAQPHLKDIQCPVCLELMKPPIYMCENGHGYCDNCRPKLSNCPVCRGKLTTERKLDSEMLSRSIKLHCQFQTSGCTQLNFLTEKKKHEELCLYKRRECPLGKERCKAEVDPAVAKDHILVTHAKLVTSHRLNSIKSPTEFFPQVHVRKTGNDVFVVSLSPKKDNRYYDYTTGIFVSCTYVGSADEARQYKYKIELYSRKSYRMLSYSSLCLSYLEMLGRGTNVKTCIFLPDVVLQEFYNEDKSLTYEIKIVNIWE